MDGAGRGCNTLTGRFDVGTASYASNGDVQALAADFEQHCEGGSPALLFGSIRINANLRQLSVTSALVLKNQATFTVPLNPASEKTVLVTFSTADGTAIAGGDYYAAFQTVTFAPGETAHTVVVPLIPQQEDRPLRNFFGQLSAPSGAPIWINQGTATIQAFNDHD